jgi:hypothetical protein
LNTSICKANGNDLSLSSRGHRASDGDNINQLSRQPHSGDPASPLAPTHTDRKTRSFSTSTSYTGLPTSERTSRYSNRAPSLAIVLWPLPTFTSLHTLPDVITQTHSTFNVLLLQAQAGRSARRQREGKRLRTRSIAVVKVPSASARRERSRRLSSRAVHRQLRSPPRFPSCYSVLPVSAPPYIEDWNIADPILLCADTASLPSPRLQQPESVSPSSNTTTRTVPSSSPPGEASSPSSSSELAPQASSSG